MSEELTFGDLAVGDHFDHAPVENPPPGPPSPPHRYKKIDDSGAIGAMGGYSRWHPSQKVSRREDPNLAWIDEQTDIQSLRAALLAARARVVELEGALERLRGHMEALRHGSEPEMSNARALEVLEEALAAAPSLLAGAVEELLAIEEIFAPKFSYLETDVGTRAITPTDFAVRINSALSRLRAAAYGTEDEK